MRHVPRVTSITLLPHLLVALALVPATVGAAAPPTRPAVEAVRASGPLHLDGVLDEPDWQRAPAATGFLVLAPREGEAPAESTVVRVLYDDTRVVFGIWCGARRSPRSSLAPRDGILDGDNIIVHLDTEGDGQRAYIFGLNPQGVQVDGILTGGDPDFRWDAVWYGEAHRDSASWSVEIAVPFRTLRFPARNTVPWRVWVRRENTAQNESTSWPPYERGTAGAIMLQAADLTGITGVRSGHAMTVEPYVFGALTDARGPDPADAGLTPWERQTRRDAGVDVQTALTSRLTLNATLHPDFSQIESDALLIDQNQRYPLQYSEKRPFFLEGGEFLSTPLDLLYTRRIAAPRAGLKLTGRALGWDSGALLVRDDGGASVAGSGYGSDADSRPGWFGVARGARPLSDGNTIGFLTGLHTQDSVNGYVFPADTERHTGALGTVNGFFAGDAALRFGKRWSWTGQAGWTQTRFDTLVSNAGRQSTSFGDRIAVSRLYYDDGTYYVHLGLREIGPHYRDELGFSDRVDARMAHLVTTADMRFKQGPLQRIKFNDDVFVVHDTHGALTYANVNPWVTFSLRANAAIAPGVEVIDEDWLGRHYPQTRYDLYLEDFLWRAFDFTCFASVGDAVAYGATDAESYAAWSETEDITANVRPREWLTAEANVKHLRLSRTSFGDPVLEQWLTGVKVTGQFTHHLSVRLYPQYDSASKHLAGNALVGYVLHPGTVLYLGVNGGFDKLRTRTFETARQVFLKASYRFEL